MKSVTLGEIEGRIVGFSLDDDGENAELQVKDENGKTSKVTVPWDENAPMPAGKVKIVQSIEFEGGKGGGGSKGSVNYLFGKNGEILIDPEDDKPFPARTGPKGRQAAAEKRLETARKQAGGEPNSSQVRKLKDAFSASGKSVEAWNKNPSLDFKG